MRTNPVESDAPEADAETTEPPGFDRNHFRAVLGHFPTGVTIVTGRADGRGDGSPVGFTIGSFTSISLEPPLVGFFAMTNSDTWAAMADYGRFCVNVLHSDQDELCWRFAKSAVDDGRFASLAWTPSATGCPVIDGVAAWIDCTVSDVVELGDHYLVVGEVVGLDHCAEPPDPLVFFRGQLGGFSGAD